MSSDWTIRSRRVILPAGMQPASISVRNGVIVQVGAYDGPYDRQVDDLVIMPGLLDTHVHINEPGRTNWEGFSSATRAAALGGITTVIEMPLNSIPATTSVAGLREKVSAAHQQCWVDVGFWGGVVPGNLNQLDPLFKAGCFGFKCFLVPSGVDEFPAIERCELRRAMSRLAGMGSVLLVHAELPEYLSSPPMGGRKYSDYLNSRPPSAEISAIQLMLDLCRETGCRIHIVHLSSAEAIPILRQARNEGLPVTVETCPHYLTFCAEEVPDGATEFKCAPPIRTASNREALWRALNERMIDMVASDHSPCLPEMKQKLSGDFGAAWGGIASLQLMLPVLWTEAWARGFTEEAVAHWMAAEPARMAGLSGRKGSIAAGYDADLVVWDPEGEFTVRPEDLRHRHQLTPYAGRRLRGTVKETYLRGQPVRETEAPRGKVLLSGTAQDAMLIGPQSL